MNRLHAEFRIYTQSQAARLLGTVGDVEVTGSGPIAIRGDDYRQHSISYTRVESLAAALVITGVERYRVRVYLNGDTLTGDIADALVPGWRK